MGNATDKERQQAFVDACLRQANSATDSVYFIAKASLIPAAQALLDAWPEGTTVPEELSLEVVRDNDVYFELRFGTGASRVSVGFLTQLSKLDQDADGLLLQIELKEAMAKLDAEFQGAENLE